MQSDLHLWIAALGCEAITLESSVRTDSHHLVDSLWIIGGLNRNAWRRPALCSALHKRLGSECGQSRSNGFRNQCLASRSNEWRWMVFAGCYLATRRNSDRLGFQRECLYMGESTQTFSRRSFCWWKTVWYWDSPFEAQAEALIRFPWPHAGFFGQINHNSMQITTNRSAWAAIDSGAATFINLASSQGVLSSNEAPKVRTKLKFSYWSH